MFVSSSVKRDLQPIENYLMTHQLDLNRYRARVGVGRTVCFGCVYKRNGVYAESRQGWRHPELYHLLLEYAKKHVKIQWDAIQVNQNYLAQKHRDENNWGLSHIVACGDYKGGDLCMESSGGVIRENIRYRPVEFCGGKRTHWTGEWTGNRFSIVFFATDFKPKTIIDCTEYHPYYDGALWWLLRNEGFGKWAKIDRKGYTVGILDEEKID